MANGFADKFFGQFGNKLKSMQDQVRNDTPKPEDRSTPRDNDNNNNREDFNGDDKKPKLNLWGQPEKPKPAGDPPTPRDPKEVQAEVDEYFRSINFEEVFTPAEMSEAMESGDFSKVNAKMIAHSQDIVRKALLESNKVIEARVDKAVKDAVAATKKAIGEDTMKDKLRAAFPSIANNPNLAPVMWAVGNQARNHGAESLDDIQDVVKRFFSDIRNIDTEEFGDLGRAPGAQMGQPGARRGSKSVDWDAFFQMSDNSQ